LIGKVNTTLTDAMTPEQAAAYTTANKQYANLKAVENMVRASNDRCVREPDPAVRWIAVVVFMKTEQPANANLDHRGS